MNTEFIKYNPYNNYTVDEDWMQSQRIKQVLDVDYNQYESQADKNKKREILAKLQ